MSMLHLSLVPQPLFIAWVKVLCITGCNVGEDVLDGTDKAGVIIPL